jgi:hypothetical protein
MARNPAEPRQDVVVWKPRGFARCRCFNTLPPQCISYGYYGGTRLNAILTVLVRVSRVHCFGASGIQIISTAFLLPGIRALGERRPPRKTACVADSYRGGREGSHTTTFPSGCISHHFMGLEKKRLFKNVQLDKKRTQLRKGSGLTWQRGSDDCRF